MGSKALATEPLSNNIIVTKIVIKYNERLMCNVFFRFFYDMEAIRMSFISEM